MKKFSTHILLLIAAVLGLTIPACTDDIDYPRPADEPFDGITLTIPNPALLQSTRAEEAGITTAESKITDLRLFAFNTDGSLFKQFDLSDKIHPAGSLSAHEAYKKVEFDYSDFLGNNESSKSFKIYVVANLPYYLESDAKQTLFKGNSITETDLLGLKADFSNGNSYKLSQANVETNGLPMVTLHEDLLFNTVETNGAITIERGKSAEIHADLAFLCAKVRLNIFFDNSDYSKDVFTQNTFLNFPGTPISFSSVLNNTLVKGRGTDANIKLENLALSSRKYPTDMTKVEEYPTDDQIETDLEEAAISNGAAQRAWQTTLYLPEQAAGIEMVMAALTEDGSAKKLGDLEYKLCLIPTKDANSTVASGSKAINRATYYNVTARILGPQTMKVEKIEVKPWELSQLTYRLQGPVYLHIDKTLIPNLNAGQKKGIWYDTNVADGEFKGVSKKVLVDHDSVPLFIFSKNTSLDTIFVQINPAITAPYFLDVREQIKSDTTLKYFHLQARTLNKLVKVDPLNLIRSFNVTPKLFAFDVREMMASGNMTNATFTYTVETNIPSFQVKGNENEWDYDEISNHIKIQVQTAQDADTYRDITPAELKAGYTVSMSNFNRGIVKFRIVADDINAGYDIFKSGTTENIFRLIPDNSGVDDVTERLGDAKMTVKVIPANDDYIIHFRGNKKGDGPDDYWGYNEKDDYWSVHMYAYQPLTIPMSCTLKVGGNGRPMAGLPVETNQGGNRSDALASNEYFFTGKSVFKGWDEPANKKCLEEAGKPGVSVGFWNGFIQLPWLDYGDWQNTNDKRFYTDVDFFEEYHTPMPCPKCSNGTYEGTTCMVKESNGWWKITLPGVATPGKTFLIFLRCHTDWNGDRYPAANQVGLPLFDYPSREGWIDLSEGMKSFTSVNKQNGGGEESDLQAGYRRIYYKNTDNWTPPYCYPWKMVNGGADNFGYNWPGIEMKQKSVNGTTYWYVDVPSDTEKVIFNPGNKNNQTGDITLTSDNYYDRTRAIDNIDDGLGSGGGGNNDQFDPTKEYTYRIYWKRNHSVVREYMKVWNSGSDNLPSSLSNNGYYKASVVNTTYNWCYYEFKATGDSWVINGMFLSDTGNSNYTNTFRLTPSDFTPHANEPQASYSERECVKYRENLP